MAVHVRLREVLETRGLSQTDLQLRTGLAYSTVNDLFHDKVRRIELATLDTLCRALQCEPGDLLEFQP
jgi:putative transcriptional regulator